MRSQSADAAAGLDSSDAWHVDIQQHQIEGPLLNNAHGVSTRADFFDSKATGCQGSPNYFAQRWLVVHNENAN
jgi:hypothetical protein